MRFRHVALDRRAHRLGAEEKSSLFAARVQQTVGEDVAPFRVAAQLDFVDREKGHAQIDRHRLDGAHEIPRLRRHDLFFAGDEGGRFRALNTGYFVVNLAGQKPEGQADHARTVREHALDREVGLAGVGRSQDRGHPAAIKDNN